MEEKDQKDRMCEEGERGGGGERRLLCFMHKKYETPWDESSSCEHEILQDIA